MIPFSSYAENYKIETDGIRVQEDILLVLIGLVGLFVGGDWLVTGASRLARSMGVSSLIVGLTVVAFGTSSPELLVSVQAAMDGSSDISVGNVVGSNISNIGLILGATALVFPVTVRATLLRREIPLMIVITLIVTAMAFIGQDIGRVDGVILLIMLVAFNGLMYWLTRQEHETGNLSEVESAIDSKTEPIIPNERRKVEVVRLLIGLAVLVVGARLTVDGAVAIARELEISELAIGITLVAIGTSLPELATSIVAALRKQNDIAIGNIVGSNIFNLLLILGATAVIRPITVTQRVLEFDLLVMLAFSFALIPLTWTAGKVSRIEAILLLVAYVSFVILALGT